ncbi:MAG: hypothetical protein K2X39_06180, partial [Silvanigrellaceae bacterium]|nr:hypothetical protein [Silvanigrellaceae bacterium]
MFFIYEIIQKLFYFFLCLVSDFSKNKRLKIFKNLRSFNDFKKEVDNSYKTFISLKNQHKEIEVYWVHVASAGEMEQVIPVARSLHDKLKVYFFLTFYSPSAIPFVKNFPGLIGAAGLPLDIQKNYFYLLSNLPIKKVFFVRYDLWPGLIKMSKKYSIELNLLAATSNSTHGGILGLLSKQFKKNICKYFDNIFCVNQNDEKFFKKHLSHHTNIYLAGDAKWARALERVKEFYSKQQNVEVKCLIDAINFYKETSKKKCIVFGSPHQAEHDLAIDCLKIKNKYILIYVPHSVEEEYCKKIFQQFLKKTENVILFSNFYEAYKQDFRFINK